MTTPFPLQRFKKMSSFAVLHASQLITLAGPKRPRAGSELSDIAIVRDGGMLIRNGRIDVAGSSNDIEKKAGDAEVIDARGKVVLPGFVDAHTHLVFAANRLDDFERRARGDTYEQIARAGGGIWSTVEKTRAASEDDLLVQAGKHADWFLRCGTTTVESKSGYGLTLEDENLASYEAPQSRDAARNCADVPGRARGATQDVRR
jgi:imidazolonepropionase